MANTKNKCVLPDHPSPDKHMVGTAPIGMETKLTWVGKVSSADIPRPTNCGEARAKNTHAVEHLHGLHNNYLIWCDCKPSPGCKETWKP